MTEKNKIKTIFDNDSRVHASSFIGAA